MTSLADSPSNSAGTTLAQQRGRSVWSNVKSVTKHALLIGFGFLML